MVQVIQQSSQDWKANRERKTAQVLQKLAGESKEQEASRRAAALGLPYLDLHIYPANPEDVTLIAEEDARRLGIAIFDKTGSTVRVAFADPENTESESFVTRIAESNRWTIEPYVVSEQSLEKVWETYVSAPVVRNLDLLRVSLTGEDLKRFEKDFQGLLSLERATTVSISQTIEVILAGANRLRASDIHIEPEADAVRLRYRIDGVLQDIGSISKEIYRLTLSRVKMLARMKINVRDRSQDGHFGIEIDGKKVDLRANVIPGSHGESINLRILDTESVFLDLKTLGLDGETLEKVNHAIRKPNGMIINTGPTGSGKTTTLYSLLHAINSAGVKIITVEDPIEYQLPGIVQTEVSKDRSYTFAQALRAIVRQDPDVILVGEIRDEETAEVAVNAALTGHLLFTTIHANTAAGTVSRLIELGIKPSLISSATDIIIGQRLVRVLCEHCRESYEPAQETLDGITQILSVISPKAKVDIPRDADRLWKSVGCEKCGFTGFHGRIGIFEAFAVTKPIEEKIAELASEREITLAAIEDGMVTMLQDGILKALRGVTTLEEVWRATGQRDTLQEIYRELMPSLLSGSSVIPSDLISEVRSHIASFDELQTYAESLDENRFIRAVFAAALILKAGDVHLEPTDDRILVRFRIDGILQTVLSFPKNLYPAVLGEIKLWSGLKTAERSGVVDGRFTLSVPEPSGDVGAGKTDIRLSIILGGYGETAVMRILGGSAVELSLEALEFRKTNLDRILTAIRKPNGIIVNVGPTGSGKTTTLYSILSKLNTPEVKIITVEDPIEYQLPGILQTQVDQEGGYSFAEALPALLRQNPDILMIGEIRDEDTARTAIQAAVTGHLVLSTVHANSAAGTVSRLLGMGVSSDDLANAADCFISQRLVRKLCPNCRKTDKPTDEETVMIERIIAEAPEGTVGQDADTGTVYRAVGCPECNGVGYAGQIVLAEVLLNDREMERLISGNALTSEIEDAAVKNGMIPLAIDGLLAALEGRTTLEEIRRITNE
ncbi:MAG: type II/IV secretion system protein [Candidatus Moranbacteria bacterium]|nr:type II/IV secretion system protein [Candidatus Moranbacteria bacterium]